LLLGPQGSGKGTQAKRIAGDRQIPHVSTGDMFRALDDSTELGREVAAVMARGELVPDEITIRMIQERLAEDDAVDGMLGGIGRRLDAILYFDVPDDVALERMENRAREENRADDNPGAMQKRLAIYHAETVPVVEHYRATGKLVPLHAGRSVDAVSDEIQKALDLLDHAA
jgi:adenylate kinase